MSNPEGQEAQADDTFTITLQAVGRDQRPAITRLRAFLKWSLRAAGFKCVALRPGGPHDGK